MKVKLVIFCSLFLALIQLNPGFCAENSFVHHESIEEINKKFKDPNLNIKRFIQRFEADDREVFIYKENIIEQLKIKPGSYIADVGTGTGIFIEGLAKATGPNGWLYAVDISPAFLNHSRKLAEVKEINNISFVLNTESSVCLPPQSVDLIFLCNTYHHMTEIDGTMKSIYAALKPGGRFVIIDFDKKPDSREWIQKHIKKDVKSVRKELESLKFEYVDSIALKELTENYFLIFKKNKLKHEQ